MRAFKFPLAKLAQDDCVPTRGAYRACGCQQIPASSSSNFCAPGFAVIYLYLVWDCCWFRGRLRPVALSANQLAPVGTGDACFEGNIVDLAAGRSLFLCCDWSCGRDRGAYFLAHTLR